MYQVFEDGQSWNENTCVGIPNQSNMRSLRGQNNSIGAMPEINIQNLLGKI